MRMLNKTIVVRTQYVDDVRIELNYTLYFRLHLWEGVGTYRHEQLALDKYREWSRVWRKGFFTVGVCRSYEFVAMSSDGRNGWGQTLDDEVARDREEEHMQTNREGRLD